MARALDDTALEALASRGLVRRAAADVAAGLATLADESADEARVNVDGQTVRLSAHGVTQGGCTCPAPGICRHRLAALILLRAAAVEAPGPPSAEATEDGMDAAPEPAPPLESVASPADWSLIVGGFTAELLARFGGAVAWRAALARPPAVGAAEVRIQDATLQVRLDGETVTFLAQGGLPQSVLASALTKVSDRRRKPLIVLAALAARQALGLPAVTEADDAAAAPARIADAAGDNSVMDAVRAALRRASFSALAFASVALEDELRRLAIAGRVEALPRLAGSLRLLAGGVGAMRRREADADPDGLMTLMAQTYALATALAAEPAPDLRAALAGRVRAEYEPVGDLTLFGLGARLWNAPSGAHGVTAYFQAPASQQTYSLAQARSDRTDITFEPRSAFQHAPVWGLAMARSCVAEVRVTGAAASASGRLSGGQGITAVAAPWMPTAQAVRGWDCAFDDWAALEARLLEALSGGLAHPGAAERPVALLLSRYGALRFDELTQTLVWPVADAAGRWIGLTLSYDGVERDRIAVLESLARTERFWAVLATASVFEGGIELRPYAVWGDKPRLLDFMDVPGRRGAPSAAPPTDLGALLGRLRASMAVAGGGPTAFAPRSAATDRLLDAGWDLVMRRAEAGRGLLREAFAADCTALADRLVTAGLAPLARPFRSLAGDEGPEDAGLRAAFALTTARRARLRLAWMT